jgi:hypothetical protein
MTATDDGFAGVGIDAGLTLQIGRLADAITAARAGQEKLDRAPRFIKPPAATATVSASGVATFSHHGPLTGYTWTVRRITVSDAASLATTVAGTAYVYAGTIGGGQGGIQVYPENLEWGMSSLPNIANFSADQLVVQYGEHLYVEVLGGTSGQVLKSAIAYQLYQQGTARAAVQV